MDLVLEFCDSYFFDYVYAKLLPASLSPQMGGMWQKTAMREQMANATRVLERALDRSPEVYGYAPYMFGVSPHAFESVLPRYSLLRQSLSLFVVTTVFGWLLYFLVASFSYVFVFDKSVFNHPRYLKNQMSMEIKQGLGAIPYMAVLTVPWFLLELHGYSHLYMGLELNGRGYARLALEALFFILFTDFGIYLLHRWLHWPTVYKVLHKKHHKWLVCTPFASHAFHPVDGYLQSLPYHIFPMLFPLHKVSYLFLFTFVNVWTVMIHDGEYLSNDPVINGAACHTVHHLYFNYNYGQFTTLWDRLGGSYREPDRELFDTNLKKDKAVWEQQIKEVDEMIKTVEGPGDDRVYER
ncbi:AaceriAFR151Cp [[Ashbya] aceris (nom. inval.)]|nr:AaceriAFR151Cp [[Ashbya] aceris (nom. inval.)]